MSVSTRKKSMKNCTSGCETGGHKSWGECLRSKGVGIQPNLMFTGVQKQWDRELDSYRSAVRQGVQPNGTKQHQIDAAMKASEVSGVAYQGG